MTSDGDLYSQGRDAARPYRSMDVLKVVPPLFVNDNHEDYFKSTASSYHSRILWEEPRGV